MNEKLIFIEIACVFSLLLLSKKLFGKAGVLAWIPAATIIANMITVKNACIFGLNTAIGSVVFASTFLATDILAECYGAKEARRGVYMGLFGAFIFMICSQIAIRYIPSAIDYANGAMIELLSMNLRISLSSILMYFIANITDVFMYEKLKVKTNGKKMWLRNNVSTITCNCLENFGFVLLGFYGIYNFYQCIQVAFSISVIEAIVGLCDTPFLYFAIGGECLNGETRPT